jgi:hypothetical protein
MPIGRLQRGWLMSGGSRFNVLLISFSKAAIEIEQSPQEAPRMLDELMRTAPADVVRAMPPSQYGYYRCGDEHVHARICPDTRAGTQRTIVASYPQADRILARAVRRCGELLKQFDARRGDQSKSGGIQYTSRTDCR